jgi:hypothetical protein
MNITYNKLIGIDSEIFNVPLAEYKLRGAVGWTTTPKLTLGFTVSYEGVRAAVLNLGCTDPLRVHG